MARLATFEPSTARESPTLEQSIATDKPAAPPSAPPHAPPPPALPPSPTTEQ